MTRHEPFFLFSLYTLDLRWKMKYSLLAWVVTFAYWIQHFGDLLHIFCAPVCTTAPGQVTDFIFTEAAEAFYASLFMATYTTTLCACPIAFYFLVVFLRPSLFTSESAVYQQKVFGSLLFLYFTNTFVLQNCMPLVWEFWSGFVVTTQSTPDLQPTLALAPKILPYVLLVFSCLTAVFVLSQLPLLVMFFSSNNQLGPVGLFTQRPFWYFVLLLGAALISPPDFCLQFIIAFVLVGFLECWIFFYSRGGFV